MFIDKDVNIDKIRERLIFNSLFVMAYEQFINGWKDTLRAFYSDKLEFDAGVVKYLFSSKEKEKTFNQSILGAYKNKNGKPIKSLSICKSLLNLNMIDPEDFNVLKDVHEKRNKFVHEFPLLSHNVTSEDKTLLRKFMEIRTKASKRWIVEVEISTNPPEWNASFIDSDGNFVPPEEAFDIADLYFRAIADIALS